MTAIRNDEEAALVAAIESLRIRVLATPPAPPEEVAHELDRIARMAIALYGSDDGATPRSSS